MKLSIVLERLIYHTDALFVISLNKIKLDLNSPRLYKLIFLFQVQKMFSRAYQICTSTLIRIYFKLTSKQIYALSMLCLL